MKECISRHSPSNGKDAKLGRIKRRRFFFLSCFRSNSEIAPSFFSIFLHLGRNCCCSCSACEKMPTNFARAALSVFSSSLRVKNNHVLLLKKGSSTGKSNTHRSSTKDDRFQHRDETEKNAVDHPCLCRNDLGVKQHLGKGQGKKKVQETGDEIPGYDTQQI